MGGEGEVRASLWEGIPSRGLHTARDAKAAGAVRLDALRSQPLEADIASAVATATAKVIEAGWVTGPFSEDDLAAEVGPSWLPARRFGVRQGPQPFCGRYICLSSKLQAPSGRGSYFCARARGREGETKG